MAGIVDPQPVINARLAELAAEREPALDALEQQVATAAPDDARRLRRELRAARRSYARERRRIVKVLGGSTVRW